MLDINKYEAMAMIELPDGELELLKGRFDVIAGSFGSLEHIDADGVEPLVTVLDQYNVLREDVSGKLLTREEVLANAPEQYDGYFQVPETITVDC